MICNLCGPTDFPVTLRAFTFAGQTVDLVTCEACADAANVKLARAESRGAPAGQLDVDVKGYVCGPPHKPRSDKGKPRPRKKPKQPGAPDQRAIKPRVAARFVPGGRSSSGAR